MRRLTFLLITCINFTYCLAQETFPVNGAVDKAVTTIVIQNATIHVDENTVYRDAYLVISNGKVLNINGLIPSNAVPVDLKGKHIYPSFIDLNSNYGMPKMPTSERGWGKPPQYESNKKGAHGWNETLNPERRASLLIKHDEKLASSYRSSGFGVVLSHYKDGIH